MKKHHYTSRLLTVALSIAFVAGCASIVSKSEYPVAISSAPEGADIAIANGAGVVVHRGKTPTTVTLKAGAGYFKCQNYTVTFEKAGYTPHTAQIGRGIDGWYIGGNFLLGGLIGWLIVDPATGAMWTLEDLHVNMTSSQASTDEREAIHIVTIDSIPEHLRSALVRIN